MKTKPVSPLIHGIIDYVFSAALFAVPQLAGFNKKTKQLFAADAVATVLYSAATSYPLGLKHIIPYKTHRIIDSMNIALLAATIFYKPVRKNKHAVVFTLSMATAALITVLLTDWEVVTD